MAHRLRPAAAQIDTDEAEACRRLVRLNGLGIDPRPMLAGRPMAGTKSAVELHRRLQTLDPRAPVADRYATACAWLADLRLRAAAERLWAI